jgi:hypothetical protein
MADCALPDGKREYTTVQFVFAEEGMLDMKLNQAPTGLCTVVGLPEGRYLPNTPCRKAALL